MIQWTPVQLLKVMEHGSCMGRRECSDRRYSGTCVLSKGGRSLGWWDWIGHYGSGMTPLISLFQPFAICLNSTSSSWSWTSLRFVRWGGMTLYSALVEGHGPDLSSYSGFVQSNGTQWFLICNWASMARDTLDHSLYTGRGLGGFLLVERYWFLSYAKCLLYLPSSLGLLG